MGINSKPVFKQGIIMVAMEKHGNRYFDASSREKAGKACLMLLEERLNEDCYVVMEKPIEPDRPKSDIPKMKNGTLRAALEKAWDEYDTFLKLYTKESNFLIKVKQAIKDKNIDMAIDAITARGNGDSEYEDVYLAEMENV